MSSSRPYPSHATRYCRRRDLPLPCIRSAKSFSTTKTSGCASNFSSSSISARERFSPLSFALLSFALSLSAADGFLLRGLGEGGAGFSPAEDDDDDDEEEEDALLSGLLSFLLDAVVATAFGSFVLCRFGSVTSSFSSLSSFSVSVPLPEPSPPPPLACCCCQRTASAHDLLSLCLAKPAGVVKMRPHFLHGSWSSGGTGLGGGRDEEPPMLRGHEGGAVSGLADAAEAEDGAEGAGAVAAADRLLELLSPPPSPPLPPPPPPSFAMRT